MSDSLDNGLRMKVQTLIDLWDRCCPRLEADSSTPSEGVVRVQEHPRLRGGCPQHLRSDNGPEFTGKALDQWATSAGVQLKFPARQADGERPRGEFQWQFLRGMPERLSRGLGRMCWLTGCQG